MDTSVYIVWSLHRLVTVVALDCVFRRREDAEAYVEDMNASELATTYCFYMTKQAVCTCGRP